MIGRLIGWSLRHRVVVLLASLGLLAAGTRAVHDLALDAIPDLSEVQVIVATSFAGQPPQVVEDQVTYPLASTLVAAPGVATVRGISMFGESYLYAIFKDGTDTYWARSRVTEALSQASSRLPAGVAPALGPDASAVGWVLEYALVDRQHRYEPDRLRALQDFFLKLELQSVPGVAEVASLGGSVRQFQIEANPNRLAGYKLSLDRVAAAVRDANLSAGGSTLEMGRAEYMVRAPGYLQSLDDFRQIPVASDSAGRPVRLDDVARVQIGAQARRGVADLNGLGDVPAAIVLMRPGGNALQVTEAVKAKLEELKRSLPEGVEIVVTYDRSGLIRGAVGTLKVKLIEESVAVALACLLFLLHLRSALVIVCTLPLGVLAALAVLQAQGISANLMSLGGIAIAIGAMVDAAIVMVENMHKHLGRNADPAARWDIVRAAATQVGPALFFSLLVITVSFLPVFALTGQEGRLFAPLAYTKTYAMAASALLAVTLTPVLMGYLVRGRIVPERRNAVIRALQSLYRPVLLQALRHPWLTLALAFAALVSAAWPMTRLGLEFMPPLYEDSLLYMPTTSPSISVEEAARQLQVTDRMIGQMPEVAGVFGKAGRADTATDPAPLSMFETTILLKPRSQWPAGESVEDLVNKLDAHVRLPGLTNGWGYPIRTRIDMLATGIRTPLGLKISGPDLEGVAQLAREVELRLASVPGTRHAFAERVGGGRYLDIELDRARAARYGVSMADLQAVVAGAIGGQDIGSVISGREHDAINLRYPRAWRDSPQAIADLPLQTEAGGSVRLGEVARVAIRDGATEIRSENARLSAYVFLDLDGGDLGGYVARAQQALDQIRMPPGYAVAWSGQYEQIEHARARLQWLVPVTIVLAALLLYAHLRSWPRVLLVLSCLPFALIGGIWLIYALHYRMSVAVAVGFIALAGVAVEFGVVMLLYLDQACASARQGAAVRTAARLRRGVLRGAVSRVRPKAMTVAVIVGGLAPVMLADGLGADVMKRIAAPLIGGMLTAPLLSMLVIPVLYEIWQRRLSGGQAARAADPDR